MRCKEGPVPSQGRVSWLDFSVVADDQMTLLFQEPSSMWWPHVPLQGKHWCHVSETCAGTGAIGMAAESHNMKVVVRNELREATCHALRRLSEVPVVQGSIETSSTVAEMRRAHPEPSVLTAGTACQPYSNLGDRQSFRDPRSKTLPRTLRAAMLLQSSSVILECVAQANNDSFVQHCISLFCKATGFRASQVVLDLADVWVARRSRHVVGDVLSHTLLCRDDVDALRLSRYEMRRFNESKPIADFLLQAQEPLPTSLHSWGNQLTGCPCGCRSLPFSEQRLSKGIHGVLTLCNGSEHQHTPYRHLAPSEVALLNGVDPTMPWNQMQRLGPCLLGQLASPLQASWIIAQVRALPRMQVFRLARLLMDSRPWMNNAMTSCRRQ